MQLPWQDVRAQTQCLGQVEELNLPLSITGHSTWWEMLSRDVPGVPHLPISHYKLLVHVFYSCCHLPQWKDFKKKKKMEDIFMGKKKFPRVYSDYWQLLAWKSNLELFSTLNTDYRDTEENLCKITHKGHRRLKVHISKCHPFSGISHTVRS